MTGRVFGKFLVGPARVQAQFKALHHPRVAVGIINQEHRFALVIAKGALAGDGRGLIADFAHFANSIAGRYSCSDTWSAFMPKSSPTRPPLTDRSAGTM